MNGTIVCCLSEGIPSFDCSVCLGHFLNQRISSMTMDK